MAPDPFPGFLLSAQPCRPSSRGQITLRSANLLDAPLIEPNSLATEEDVQALLQASQLLRRLAATPAFSAVIESELAPGSALQSPEQLIEDIRQRASTVFHPVSTCRMGPHASQAVVNAKLQVHGLQGLRVVDASVFPTLTSGNTHAPTLMLAERGADLILDATP
jgi:choline dehydrogenase